MCRELGYGRGLGEGLRRMVSEMQEAGLATPTVHQHSAGVAVVLSMDTLDGRLARHFGPEVIALVGLIREAGRIGTGDLVRSSGRSRPWVLKQLAALRDAGVVERVGSSGTDPTAVWRLLPARG